MWNKSFFCVHFKPQITKSSQELKLHATTNTFGEKKRKQDDLQRKQVPPTRDGVDLDCCCFACEKRE